MLCVFTFEELAHGNPSGITTARNTERRKHIHKLDSAMMMYIQGEFGTCTLWYEVLTLSFYNYTDFVESKWPNSFVNERIMKKLTQRCTDLHGEYEKSKNM